MTETKTVKQSAKAWNFPHEGITVFAETQEEALKEFNAIQKKLSNSLKK